MKRAIILASISVLCLLQIGWSQVPQTMSYQGVLRDASGNLINDSVNLAFSLFSDSTEGTKLWGPEDYYNFNVTSGIFQVILGSSVPLDLAFDTQYWLQITVNGGPLSPRTKLTAVPYSLASQSVAGGTNIFPATGNVGIGTTSPDWKLVVQDNFDGYARSAFQNVNTGANRRQDIMISTGGSEGIYLGIDQGGALEPGINAYLDNRSGGNFGFFYGGGSPDLVLDINGNVGIGTTSPATALHVIGTVTANAFAGNGSGLTNLPASGWSLTGNSVTADGILGTNSNYALDIRVNGARALRLEPAATSPNVIGGYSGNSVTQGAVGATIGGGGASTAGNRVTDDYGTVAGGQDNQAGDGAGTTDDSHHCTVGGGDSNTASGNYATVSGGQNNDASNFAATVSGGWDNTASGLAATVSGGITNYATGSYATVSGGSNNTASGNNSTAMGYNSIAEPYASLAIGRYNITDNNYSKTTWTAADPVFVIGNGTSTARGNAFEVRKDGSVYVNGTLVHTSDERLKTNINPLGSVLVKIDNIEPVRFEFKNKSTHPAGTHIGLIAQNIQKEFPELVTEASNGYLSLDYSHITAVNMQAIKELKAENDALKDQVKALQEQLAQLTARVAAIDESMALVPGE